MEIVDNCVNLLICLWWNAECVYDTRLEAYFLRHVQSFNLPVYVSCAQPQSAAQCSMLPRVFYSHTTRGSYFILFFIIKFLREYIYIGRLVVVAESRFINNYSHWRELHEYRDHPRLCVCISVCLSVCLHLNTKMAETTVTKLATGIVHREYSCTN